MKWLIVFACVIGYTAVAAQTSYRQKVYAFVQKQVNGGNKHFIYIEMSGDSIPIWDSAIIDRKKFVVHFSPVEAVPVKVGHRKSDKRMVVLKTSPDSKMWMVEFDATNEIVPPADLSTDNVAVTFRGKFKGKKLNYKILREVELEAEE